MSLNKVLFYWFLLVTLSNSFLSFTQSEKKIDNKQFADYCNSIIVNNEGLNKTQLISIADSLYAITNNRFQKVSVLLIYYNIYIQQNNYPKAIESLSKADSIAQEGKLIADQVSIKITLSGVYREVGLANKGLEELNIALRLIEKLTQNTNTLCLKSRIYNEKSMYLFENKEIKEAKKYLSKSINTLKNKEISKVYTPLFDAHLKLGSIYFDENNFELAQKEFEESFELANKFYQIDSEDIGICFTNLGIIALKQNNLDSANNYFSKAIQIAKKFNNSFLLENIYISLDEYYVQIGDQKSSDSIKSELIKMNAEKNNYQIQVANKIIKDEINKTNTKKTTISYLTFFIVFLIIISIGIIIYFKINQKKQKKHFNTIIYNITKSNDEKSTPVSKSTDKQEEQSFEKSNNYLISESKEKEILDQLILFERNKDFLDKKISIALMASALNTNTKYLTYILKKHRSKNFVEYINSIRINYIVKELYNNSELQKYKISHLAELSGFSSHSRFTQVFKKETNMHPSDFITKLDLMKIA